MNGKIDPRTIHLKHDNDQLKSHAVECVKRVGPKMIDEILAILTPRIEEDCGGIESIIAAFALVGMMSVVESIVDEDEE